MRTHRNIYGESFHATVFEAWQLCQEERDTVKEHAEEEMNMPVLRDTLKAVYIFSLAQFARDAEAGWRSKVWLVYCMLP